MKEIKDIIEAYSIAKQQSIRTALATVVKVEGSSYRRPGARMLITETGEMTGAISGGCLEGDALTKAKLAIHQQQNKIVVYDTSDDEDAKLGMQLGCNGIVHILFEPVKDEENNPVALLSKAVAARRDAVTGTYFSINNSEPHAGTTLLHTDDDIVHFRDLREEISSVFKTRQSAIVAHESSNVLLQLITPVTHLVIGGAGNDAKPLMALADVLGWEVTIADGRRTHATSMRFPKAKKIVTGKPADILEQLVLDRYTAIVLMTHNYNYDLELLQLLLNKDLPYIGLLGPKKKFDRMVGELAEKNITIDKEKLKTLFAPVGLDLGAETAEEIALSIVAEVKSVLAGASGKRLTNKEEAIHSRS